MVVVESFVFCLQKKQILRELVVVDVPGEPKVSEKSRLLLRFRLWGMSLGAYQRISINSQSILIEAFAYAKIPESPEPC